METVKNDTGLQCLALLLRFHQVPVDPAQIAHQFSGASIGVAEMLRCAKDLKLKARAVTTNWAGLMKLPLPAIVELEDKTFIIVGKVTAEVALVQSPSEDRPRIIKRAEFEYDWTGRVVLMVRRASLADVARRFDITWFLQAMHKYRHLLGEVLVASFFLQLFALVTPLFFQVVTDKVLTHRGFTTLDVLVIGLITVSIFETVLGSLRTYVFAHTTNRIDVELGTRLFKHLIALPIGYFEARRAGDSVARMRELENIRNFLTGSALTLVIDLGFTFVFLAVMFYYSPLLSWIVVGSFPFYIALSAGVTPVFRRRLEKKFDRGAENQSFLVESVSAIQTLKAMAIEPQMQRRWEEQLAGYVGSSFDVLSLGNWTSQAVQFISKIVTALTLYFGALSRHRRATDRRRTDRVQHAGRPRRPAGAAIGPALAGLSPGAGVDRPARGYPQYNAGAGIQCRSRRPATDQGRHHLRPYYVSLPVRRPDGPHRHFPKDFRRASHRHRRSLRFRQIHADKAGSAALRARERPHPDRRDRSDGGGCRLVAASNRVCLAGKRSLQPLDPGQHRSRRLWHGNGAGDRRGRARRRP